MSQARSRVGREKLSSVRAEILPARRAPWGAVAAVYERLRAGGATELTFAEFEVAPEEMRDRDRLPPPGSGGSRPGEAGGMEVLAAWLASPYAFVRAASDDEPEEPEPEIPIDLEEDD